MSSDLENAIKDALKAIKDLEASAPTEMAGDFEQAKSEIVKAKTPYEVKKIVAALKEMVKVKKDALNAIKDLEASAPAEMAGDFEQAKKDIAKAKTKQNVDEIVKALNKKVEDNIFKEKLKKMRDKNTPPKNTSPKPPNG